MERQTYKLKQDGFRKARGGYARFWNIYCAACQQHLLLYQKDGPGPLKRMYADRIIAPKELCENLSATRAKHKSPLICHKCRAVMALPYIYEKENRPAFLVTIGSLFKKVGRGFYPPPV